MERFAAKLLFQYRVDLGTSSAKQRTCEERIINFVAASAADAVSLAHKKGKLAAHSYLNSDGHRVFFQFVGVMDMLHLGAECEPEEVWYDIRERLLPKERRARLVLTRRQLLSQLSRTVA